MESAIHYRTTALLFDLDDTLYDRDKAFQSWAQAFVRMYFPVQNDIHYQELVDNIISLDAHGYNPRITLFSKVKEIHPSLEFTVDQLVEMFYQQFLLHLHMDTPTQHLLASLKHNNISFGIVTNGSYHQMHKIEVLGLTSLTSCIFISEVFGSKKPEAKIFLAAAACLQTPVHRILFVGDNPHADIWGAQNVGMRTVWLPRRQPWPSTLSDISADFIISSLEDLLPVLDTTHRDDTD